ncbi:hypothetical protein [Streptomyces sp. LNU-CPARS28]|uniref:hypothetical protein n=1 Tax=Streptomyces sp. LNU-CPARS28 TaxID=3137371 RepID=UPI003136A69C
MSAPAPTSRPSPADMPPHPVPHPASNPAASPTGFTTALTPAAPAPAARGRGSAQAAIAPGKLRSSEVFRSVYRRGIFLSGMTPEARLVAHTLVWYASHRNGHISTNHAPDVERLAEESGLTPLRVQVQLEVLAQRGWLQYRRFSDGPRKGGQRMVLTIPALYLERVRAVRSQARSNGS